MLFSPESKKTTVLYLAIALIAGILIWFGAIFLRSSQLAKNTSPEAVQPTAEKVNLDEAKYVHPDGLFSFIKPLNYTVGRTPDDQGRDVLLVQPISGDIKKAFQIGIAELDKPINLTPELIKRDIPDIEIRDAQKIVLDTKGTGLLFFSNNPAFGGKSFEIWFATNTHLYQISSYAEFADQLQAIIGTWKFPN